MSTSHIPPVQLLTSPDCSHCHALRQMLEQRHADGRITDLRIIDVSLDPAPLRELGVRSVPWMRIGELEFEGAMGESELDRWLSISDTPEGQTAYVAGQLENGALDRLLRLFHSGRLSLTVLLPLLSDAETPISVRLGLAAILESLEGTSALQALEPHLTALLAHDNPTVRMDACHYLSLIHSASARKAIEGLLADDNDQVREAARDCLEDAGALH